MTYIVGLGGMGIKHHPKSYTCSQVDLLCEDSRKNLGQVVLYIMM